jgi:glycosyltransferase involved in cell wall biosynthesis
LGHTKRLQLLGGQGTMIKVVLRAPVLSKSGYGEHARFVYRSLRSQPEVFDIYVHPTNWGKSSWISGDTEEIRNINQDIQKLARNPKQPMDLSIQVTIPNEWEKMAPVNIGVTAGIETSHVSPEWLQKANIMDKVIVVSEHAKQGFVKASYNVQDNNGNDLGTLTCQTPIDVVGYPVKDITPVDLSEKLNLSTDFNFLTIAQWGPRKNLENTVKWFVEEFRDEEVGLVIKTHRANMSLGDRRNTETLLKIFLDKLGERNCKIHYLHGDMTEEELHGLYVHPKIKGFVSATHGEGFGLPLFEAAYSGLPIAAPAWSGHVDFLYGNITNAVSGKTKRGPLFEKIQYDLEPVQPAAHWKTVINPDMKWCFPKEKSFKKALRSLFKSNEMKQMVAQDLREQLLAQEDKIVAQAENIKSLLEWGNRKNEIKVL